MLIAAVIPSYRIYKIMGGQRAARGHAITFPQDVCEVARSLPRTSLPIIIVEKDIQGSKRLLRVRRNSVAKALQWLKMNNIYYRGIAIDASTLDSLPEDGVYDKVRITNDDIVLEQVDEEPEVAAKEDFVIMHSSCMLQMPLKEMESALRERLLQEKLQWPTVSDQPLNEFQTSGLMSLAFPHLFPTGAGDYSASRLRDIQIGDYVKHLMKYKDGRFRKDDRFFFMQ
jgi:hypothetical protein